MAKINPIKVKQDADKQEKAGRFDQAISFYRQLVEDNPRDWNTINKIGDLFAKLRARPGRRARSTPRSRSSTRETASCSRPSRSGRRSTSSTRTVLEPYLNLADLYAKQGLMMEAKGQYQIVVDEYVKRGRGRDAADVLQQDGRDRPGRPEDPQQARRSLHPRRQHGQGRRGVRGDRRRAQQEGSPRRGAAGAREGAEARLVEQSAARGAGSHPLCSRRTSSGRPQFLEEALETAPDDAAPAREPGGGVSWCPQGRGGRGRPPTSARARSVRPGGPHPDGSGPRASRPAGSSLRRVRSRRSTSCSSAGRASAPLRSCSSSSRRTLPTSAAWSSWSRSTACSRTTGP